MSINDQRLTRRVEDLYASDAQFAAASPNEAITQAIDQPGVALPQLIRMVMEGYADRPALGQRALRFVTDPDSGRTMVELLPRFETITYRELWARAGTLATALSAEPAIRPGDRVCVLGFNSVDYTTIDIALIRLGAVSVPLQTSAPVTGLRPIVTETEPTMIATSIDNLGDAVEVLAGHAPARLVVFDYHGKVDTHREAVEAARARLAGSVTIDTLAELIERGRALPATPIADSADDALALLIYTSGSTGAPKGAMYRESQVMSFWRKSSGWFEPSGYPSITLNFMPMSHVGGRQVLYGTLSNGGTAYFVAKSDLSTLFEDLALVRPTELCFVPRIWDMVFAEFHSEVDRRLVDGADRAALEAQVKAELRENVLGGRFVMALTGSAPISAEMTAWVESLLADVHLVEGYGSTEAGMVLNDGMVRRPAVIDYKLVDVPELGYFGTDQPYPRGELLPVGVIVSPASDLRALADHIEAARTGVRRPSFASIHGRSATEVHASDLTLDKFIDAATLAAAPNLPAPSAQVRTVLLTGATGFLGRYLALEWLDRMDLVNGKLICLVRARSDEEAQARLDATFDSGDPYLVRHYRELGAGRLEVLAGDKGEADLGLDRVTWQRLADTVDLIVDPAALVNHVLPYSQLFGPNAAGTAELLRLALTGKRKPYIYTSTIAVGEQIPPEAFTEDADIRAISPTRRIDDSYANGYANSKWAGEVLLREAHEQCGLPVTVFRCDMILADTSYTGQLNLPDMFTRLMLSLAATGIAPGSFYELDAHGNRQRAHYDGLPVEFVAEAICTLGTHSPDRFVTYHVMNPYDDGIGLDEFVDWLNSPTSGSGCTIQRIADYGEWLQRFETSLRALPDRQRHASLLPLLHNYREPAKPICGSIAPTDQFRAAVQEAKIGPDKDIPHLTAAIIAKYISNLRLLGLL